MQTVYVCQRVLMHRFEASCVIAYGACNAVYAKAHIIRAEYIRFGILVKATAHEIALDARKSPCFVD